MTRSLLRSLVVCAFAASVPPAAAQDVSQIRSLYISAAYDDALAVMPTAGADTSTEIEQYRALCLLALGREEEALDAIERLVARYPTFIPSASEVSPKMRSIFTSARSKLLPDIITQAYQDAKTAYQEKDRDAARAGFKRTMDLIDSLPEEERGELADLRLLATEFHELAAPPPAPVAEPAPALSGRPTKPVDTTYVAPVAIREEMPAWTPGPAVPRAEYTGLVRVHIGMDGAVTSVEIVQSSHPAYDAAVVRSAKTWTYKAATVGGRPVPSQKDIRIRLIPQ